MKPLRYTLGFVTDPGNRRSSNQDSLIIRRGHLDKRDFLLLAVADGMGGMAQGDRASYTAALMLDQWWDTELPLLLTQQPFDWDKLSASLSVVLEHINWTIRNQCLESGAKSGTTLSLLFLLDGRYLLKHVGDSRIYLFRKKEALQLTQDQTWCQQQIDQGRLTPEEAATHRMRHVLISALGVTDDFRCQDQLGKAQDGDWFLLCSDGFHNELTIPPQWFSGQPRDASPQDLLDSLLHQIKSGPADDNISAILLHVSEGGWRS